MAESGVGGGEEQVPAPPEDAAPSSRRSLRGAGWQCGQIGRYRELVPPGARSFSWLDPRPLLQSRNDKLVRWLGDPIDDIRQAWIAGPLAEGARNDFTISDLADRPAVSFAVLGDPGEGDGSQFAVVPGLERRAADTDFMVLCSDVIYPVGGVPDYERKFYVPYKDYPGPIYAIPGNHDWYDDLTGFLFAFCGLPPDASPPEVPGPGSPRQRRLRRLLWRKPPSATAEGAERMTRLRGSPRQQASQPGPYWAIDAGPLRLVGIDTGILGGIDADQAAWLRRVSLGSPKPKILFTGKPIYVDGLYMPCDAKNAGYVDDVVRDPRCNYVAAIGGDLHNYQRYPVRVEDGRTLQYFVAGGGGAFLHATHKIPRVDVNGVTEDAFRCYPLRGDSLAVFSRIYDRRFAFGRGLFEIPPDQASALVGERLGITPTRASARRVEITRRSRHAARIVYPLPGRKGGIFHHYYSELLDWNEPPMCKSFLRIDADATTVTITCYSATGCLEHELEPPVEDAIRATLGADGRWAWERLPPS